MKRHIFATIRTLVEQSQSSHNLATNLTQSTIGGIVKNINNLNKGQLKMPNEIILLNVIIILTTFIFLVLIGVI